MSGGPRGILNARITVDQVRGSYRTAGGGVDATTRACGGSRWSQDEPAVAMDPRDPSVLAAGANEYCALITNPDAWAGYYHSTDGGRTWLDSLVPGYQADQTAQGSASPTHGLCESAGDPTMAFDPAGRLFYGFICFSRGKTVAGREREPVNGSTFVATYDRDGARYVRTVLVAKGTRAFGIFEDKINLTVDQTAGPTSGNVYTAWAEFRRGGSGHGPPGAVILFARSTDHGATFSRPVAVTSGLLQEQFADLSVGPDGSVDVAYRNARAIWVSRSTDGGRSFGPPELVEALNEFDSEAFSGTTNTRDCGDRPYACNTGFTFPRFESQPAVAADASGVHVVWTQELPGGQAKIFVKSSADGVDWPSTGRRWMDGRSATSSCRTSARPEGSSRWPSTTRGTTPRTRRTGRRATPRAAGARGPPWTCTPRARPTAAGPGRRSG